MFIFCCFHSIRLPLMERAVLEGEFSQRKADGVKAIKVQMKETLWLCVDKRAISESDMRSQTLRHSYCLSLWRADNVFLWQHSFNAPSQTHLIKFLFNSTKCWKVCRVKSSHGIAAKISSGNKRRSRAFYQTLSGSDQNCWFNLIYIWFFFANLHFWNAHSQHQLFGPK